MKGHGMRMPPGTAAASVRTTTDVVSALTSSYSRGLALTSETSTMWSSRNMNTRKPLTPVRDEGPLTRPTSVPRTPHDADLLARSAAHAESRAFSVVVSGGARTASAAADADGSVWVTGASRVIGGHLAARSRRPSRSRRGCEDRTVARWPAIRSCVQVGCGRCGWRSRGRSLPSRQSTLGRRTRWLALLSARAALVALPPEGGMRPRARSDDFPAPEIRDLLKRSARHCPPPRWPRRTRRWWQSRSSSARACRCTAPG